MKKYIRVANGHALLYGEWHEDGSLGNAIYETTAGQGPGWRPDPHPDV